MTRLEASAWPLAAGSACVFALAVVLHALPWQVAFGSVVLAVVVWAWSRPVVMGVALGVIAWFCVTGFDVHRLGEIEITGSDDVARAAVLVLAGVLAASTHAVTEARRRRAVPIRLELHRADTSGDGMTHLECPAPRRSDTVPAGPPVHATEESNHG